ncbi:hypothetical protein [Thalassoroseus pseudoceratinae]|uniref:hypothetical protein n=1 Tax=Thalassoroseus pseudoceratinae TaxID=2713176 RepID=UPI0014226449|nr:hypothetical protein [Thalassoroseus pseudoceratinae]
MKSALKTVWSLGVLLGAGIISLTGTLYGQDFRIYTRVYNEASPNQTRASVLGRSLSLFHAGKVYDYIENGSESEVIIYEPSQERFVVLNTSRNLATTIHFDEVAHKMHLARQVTENRITELETQQPPASPDVLDQLRFPLEANLVEHFDAEQNLLTLSSPHLTYSARCVEIENQEVVDFYLEYADQIAQLNYILHPNALYPKPRLELNRHLRRLVRLPVEVRLRSSIGVETQLRAEHQVHWKLDAGDRSLIHEWESTLKSELTKNVPLNEYQRALLISQTSRR